MIQEIFILQNYKNTFLPLKLATLACSYHSFLCPSKFLYTFLVTFIDCYIVSPALDYALFSKRDHVLPTIGKALPATSWKFTKQQHAQGEDPVCIGVLLDFLFA